MPVITRWCIHKPTSRRLDLAPEPLLSVLGWWCAPCGTLAPLSLYRVQTGTECQEFMNAVMAYDCVYWLKNAIEAANSDDPVKVRDELEKTKDLKLMHATLTMDEYHNPKNKDGYILEAKDGKAVFFKKIKAE